MVTHVVHVLEDSNQNMLHVINEMETAGAKTQPPTAFVHTGHGVESASTGATKLRGNLRHRYSGIYNGSKSSYVRAAHANTNVATSNDDIIARSGMKNIKKGSGSVVTLGSVLMAGSIALGAAQLVSLWNTCSSDGFWSAAEMTRFGIEASELVINPIGSSASELFKAATNPDVDLMSAAEVPTGMERAVDHVFNNGDAYGSALCETASSGAGDFLGSLAGLLFG